VCKFSNFDFLDENFHVVMIAEYGERTFCECSSHIFHIHVSSAIQPLCRDCTCSYCVPVVGTQMCNKSVLVLPFSFSQNPVE